MRGVVGGGRSGSWEEEDDAVSRGVELASSRVELISACHSLSRRFEKSGPFPVAACLLFPQPLCVPAVVYICGLVRGVFRRQRGARFPRYAWCVLAGFF